MRILYFPGGIYLHIKMLSGRPFLQLLLHIMPPWSSVSLSSGESCGLVSHFTRLDFLSWFVFNPHSDIVVGIHPPPLVGICFEYCSVRW